MSLEIRPPELNSMSRRKLRHLTLASATYLWRVHRRHARPRAKLSGVDSEVFTAYRDQFPRAPVRVLFPETTEHGPGYPSQAGVVVDYQRPDESINLNHPRVARLLVELALEVGWAPVDSACEHIIENGFHLLRANRAKLESAMARSDSERWGAR